MPKINASALEAKTGGAYLGRSGRKPLSFYTKRFEDYRASFDLNRSERVREIDYYHGYQLTASELAELDQRKQPRQVHNRLRTAINGTIGVVIQSKTDPRVLPRTPESQGHADVAVEILRYCADKAKFDNKRAKMAKQYFLPGTVAALIGVDSDKNVTVTPIRWEEYFIDPRSREEDGSDKTYDGVGKWIYAWQLARRYPKWENVISMTGDTSVGLDAVFDESWEDRPSDHSIWMDKKNKRVFVVEMYYKEGGEWFRCVYFAGGILEEGLSPYRDHRNRTANPIESVSCYVDRKNVRYGLAKDMMDIQDGINKRHSKLLHLANTSQIEADDPAAIEVDADEARKEAARPDGVIPHGWRKVSTTDMAASQSVLLAKDEAEIERLGPNPAILGRQGSDSSGRALLTRQQAGLVELAIVIQQYDDFENRIYAQMWARVKQFWTKEMFIRVIKDVDMVEFIPINKPIIETRQVLDETGMGVVEEPYILGYENPVAEMDVDVMIDSQPETATLMAELAEKLMDLVSRVPSYQGQVPFELFLELLPLPRKTQLLKKLKAAKEESQKAQQEQMAKAAALEEAKTGSEIEKNRATAEELDTRADLNTARTQETLSKASKSAIEAFMLGEETSGTPEV